jgi:hypothetical protein
MKNNIDVVIKLLLFNINTPITLKEKFMEMLHLIVCLGTASQLTFGAPGPNTEYNLGGARPLVHF